MQNLFWIKFILVVSSIFICNCLADHLYSDNESQLDNTDYGPHNDHQDFRYGYGVTSQRRNSSGSRYSFNPKERPGRQLAPGSNHNHLQAAAAVASNDYAYPTAPEYGGYASAGHHHQSYGQKGLDCNSALGLFGVLGLVSFLTNVLNQLTTTVAPTGRKKRSTLPEYGIGEETLQDRIIRLTLPLLNSVAQIGNRKAPISCVRVEICKTNKMLVQQLGPEGRNLGNMLTIAVGKILKNFDKNGHLSKVLGKAGLAGRNGQQCERIYKTCKSLSTFKGLSDLFSQKNLRLGSSSNLKNIYKLLNSRKH